MAGYFDWNRAIIEYTTENVPKGSEIFLAIDDNSLGLVASSFLETTDKILDPPADFIEAVRAECTDQFGNINLRLILGIKEDVPAGVAFLSAMVLAAHHMKDGPGYDETNYFIPFRALLHLPNEPGRPPNLEEEPLWIVWDKWLVENGWESTAERGSEGALKFLNYTRSQALLRDDDKDYLKRIFLQEMGKDALFSLKDREQLAAWLGRWARQKTIRKYLREGFTNADPRRAGAFFDRTFDHVFSVMNWTNANSGSAYVEIAQRRIECGLVRIVQLTGPQYYLLPRRPRNLRVGTLKAIKGERQFVLHTVSESMYDKLWIQEPFVQTPEVTSLSGDPQIDRLEFPSREFWILTPDPDDSSTGVYGTWSSYANLVGQKFIVLIKDKQGDALNKAMNLYLEQKLINWDNSVKDIRGWTEYRGCMILSNSWDSIIPDDESADLYASIKPKIEASISFRGGIRVTGSNVWLTGYPPSVRVYAFTKEIQLMVILEGQKIFDKAIRSQEDYPLPNDLIPGYYVVRVEWNGQLLTQRSMAVQDWQEISPFIGDANCSNRFKGANGEFQIQGAIIKRVSGTEVFEE